MLGGRSQAEACRTLETLRSLGLEDKRLAGDDEDGYDHNGGGGGGHRSKHLTSTRSMPSMVSIAAQGTGGGAGAGLGGAGGSSRWKLPRMHSFGGSNITSSNINVGDGFDLVESGSERGEWVGSSLALTHPLITCSQHLILTTHPLITHSQLSLSLIPMPLLCPLPIGNRRWKSQSQCGQCL